jgi:anaerobic magnesium-protoporphyrin IX monomethyl ester cyclase
MRLAFVFPPSMPPTSPPCGIASLKAFLGGKAFDINLLYHDVAVDLLCRGDLPEVSEAKISGEPEQLKEAIHFLKGSTFYDIQEYNKYIALFFDYFGEVYSYVQKECLNYLTGTADDCIIDFFDRLLLPVKQYHPDVVGFSQLVLPQREITAALAAHLRREDIPSMLGGASLWYSPEAYLSEVDGIDYSHIFDVVFYGEGELSLKDYIEGEPKENIGNIVYKKKRIIKNEGKTRIALDDLPPPDFTDFSLESYYAPSVVLPLLTSRGCSWRRCTFCTHSKSYEGYRTRSIEKVVEDLKELQKRYTTSYFLLADEMIHPQRFNALSDSIIKEGLDIRFYSEVKPTKGFTRDLLQKIFRAGVRVLLWGVESGTQRVLDIIDKGTSVPHIETVLRDSHEAGIWNMVFLIMHYPTQTEEEIESDIQFLRRNAPYISTAAGSPFKLEVGSRIYESPEKFGIKTVKKSVNPFNPVCEYDGNKLSEQEDFLYKKYSVECLLLSRVSWYFGKMRDHMLLYADYLSKNPHQ